MNTEIHIENYRLDITKDISTLLNFAIDDIKDFSTRGTTWSRTIVLPGTKNNNQLFGHIYQVGQSNSYDGSQPNVGFNFNASKAAQCIIFQDQMQTFKGVMRLLQINISNGFQGKVEYEVSVFGTLVGLNSALSGALLEELDFSAYDHVYNVDNIVNSWGNPGGSGYYYPLIDYGTYSTDKHNWDIKTFRPALYVREYIDKIFNASGYRWSSSLFDTPRFKKLIIPHAKKTMTINLIELYDAKAFATFYGAPPADDIFNPTAVGVPIRFTTTTGSGFTANPEPDKVKFTYAGSVTTNIKIKIKFTGTFTRSDPMTGLGAINFYLFKNGSINLFGAVWAATTGFPSPFSIDAETTLTIAPGDFLEWRISQNFYNSISNVTLDTSEFKIESASGSTIAVPIQVGDDVDLNTNIPQNIRQIDFLVAIVKLFNLYVYEDKFDDKLIYLTPYIDYYSKNFANAVDWTYKLNRDKITKVKPMSELNAKIYKLKFKSDSDYYNDLYRKRYNEGYGDRIYDSEFEFTETTNEFEICFSGTPLVGYGGEDKVYSTIFKRSGSDTAPVEENVDSNIRILQSKRITGVVPWNITTAPGATVLSTNTNYGYAGHLDDPDIPTNDINFGATKELFFILSAGLLSENQFNVYWSNYMREITDKDSKLVTANFYLTTKDILNLDFSKYVYVDGVTFRLNAIKDYDATKPADCVVELLKVNSASYSETVGDSGPPDGCFLLWSDEQTLDYDDGEELLYGPCTGNPGDGEGGGTGGGDVDPIPPTPTTYYVNWTFNKSQPSGAMRIFRNGDMLVSSTGNSESGSFAVVAGDVIYTAVGIAPTTTNVLTVSNDVDGTMYSSSGPGSTFLTYTFAAQANKNYNINGSVI